MANQSSQTSVLSTKKMITTLQQVRNNQINELLNDINLLSFAETHFNTIALSPIKLEFLKRDLKELQDSPLDLVHYANVLRESKEKSVIVSSNHPLILIEIFTIFSKYGIHKPE